MKKCNFCEEERNEGVWNITIYRKWRGTYGKKFNFCHDCLSDALTGYHTGGGLTGDVIKKIKRIDK